MADRPLNISITLGTVVKTVLLVLAVWLLYYLRDFVLVVITAIVIASAIEPAVAALIRRKLPRLLSVIAIYLSEFASHRVREVVKPFLELLSGVPTIVYGYFALLFITPMLQAIIPGLPGFNMLSAGIVMGIMIIPYVASVSEDAMRAVPMHIREGSYAMGATRFQTALRVVTPAAASGIVAAYILGISRAVGETMVVAIAAGTQPNLTWNPLEGAATISAYIVQGLVRAQEARFAIDQAVLERTYRYLRHAIAQAEGHDARRIAHGERGAPHCFFCECCKFCIHHCVCAEGERERDDESGEFVQKFNRL